MTEGTPSDYDQLRRSVSRIKQVLKDWDPEIPEAGKCLFVDVAHALMREGLLDDPN